MCSCFCAPRILYVGQGWLRSCVEHTKLHTSRNPPENQHVLVWEYGLGAAASCKQGYTFATRMLFTPRMVQIWCSCAIIQFFQVPCFIMFHTSIMVSMTIIVHLTWEGVVVSQPPNALTTDQMRNSAPVDPRPRFR